MQMLHNFIYKVGILRYEKESNNQARNRSEY